MPGDVFVRIIVFRKVKLIYRDSELSTTPNRCMGECIVPRILILESSGDGWSSSFPNCITAVERLTISLGGLL
jgi:hypothetical protein